MYGALVEKYREGKLNTLGGRISNVILYNINLTCTEITDVFEKLTVAQLVKKFPRLFTEPSNLTAASQWVLL